MTNENNNPNQPAAEPAIQPSVRGANPISVPELHAACDQFHAALDATRIITRLSIEQGGNDALRQAGWCFASETQTIQLLNQLPQKLQFVLMLNTIYVYLHFIDHLLEITNNQGVLDEILQVRQQFAAATGLPVQFSAAAERIISDGVFYTDADREAERQPPPVFVDKTGGRIF